MEKRYLFFFALIVGILFTLKFFLIARCSIRFIPKIQIVVSRFNENTNWIHEPPFNKFPILMYEKGPQTCTFCEPPKCKKKKLPNIGRCDHTYLYYIIEHYDILPDIIIFLPGSVKIPYKYERALFFLSVAENSTEAVDKLYDKNPEIDYKRDSNLYGFYLDSYTGVASENNKINKNSKLKKSSIRPFGKWFEHHFSKDTKINDIWYSGVLITTRERIRKNPKSFYKKLIKEFSNSSDPEVGHYMERSWFTIFSNQNGFGN